MSVCVVGRGKVGRALYRALSAAGEPCVLIAGRSAARHANKSRTGFRSYVLAVSDGSIRSLASELAPMLDRRARVLHCAGARGVDELEACAARGCSVAVFHPLVSFASSERPVSLRGATFTSRGDARATREAKRLSRLVGAHCVVLPTTGEEEAARYHAAAALLANGAAALADVAARVLCELGYEQRQAERALAGLLASVASNIANVGVPQALTGPVVRGDRATVARHLTALAKSDRSASHAYAAVQPVVVASAESRGLDRAAAQAILRTSRGYAKR